MNMEKVLMKTPQFCQHHRVDSDFFFDFFFCYDILSTARSMEQTGYISFIKEDALVLRLEKGQYNSVMQGNWACLLVADESGQVSIMVYCTGKQTTSTAVALATEAHS